MGFPVGRPSLRILWRESHASSAASAGALAGLPASLVAAVALVLLDLAAGRAPAQSLAAIGAVWPGAPLAGPRLVLLALALHLAAGACLGVVFGVLVAVTAHHLPPLTGAAWGSLLGLAAWFVGFHVILPWVAPTIVAEVPAREAILWHVAYGAATGWLFHFMRPRERERHRVPAVPGRRRRDELP